jgi:glycerol uptake facilitator-like aquaporin
MKSAIVVEGLGTLLLLTVVVGSGIMGERLAEGNGAVALLANSAATAAGLYVLILTLGPVSGAQFNPAVSLLLSLIGRQPWSRTASLIPVQCAGAVLGVMVAHAMFGEPLLQVSTHARDGAPQIFSEFVATAGLLGVILRCLASRADALPQVVGLYIGAAYWFTASTSFANPAVTLARALTDSFAGIAPTSVPGFLLGQVLALVLVAVIVRTSD